MNVYEINPMSQEEQEALLEELKDKYPTDDERRQR